MTRRPAPLLPAGAAALLAMLLVPPPARAQISPGDLSRAHADLEGPRNCLGCHGDKAAEMEGRCLACHGDIALLRDRGAGLHAKAGSRPCATCHPEHAGRDFALTEWKGGSFERFDHDEAGWALAGKHASLACRDCHQPKHQAAEIMDLSKRRDRAASWVGLRTECATCHEDPHRAALGGDCARCHGQDAWKPAATFDHSKSDFPLAGKHAALECARCHPADKAAATPAVLLYRPIPHAECDACHRDPHAGRLGGACARCHTTSSFREIAPSSFDHAATRFPLRGKHAGLECARCHDPVKAWGKRPAFDRCAACHADPHRDAVAAAESRDCAACHDERAFRPSTFTLARHDATRYPLAERHRDVPCAKCHTAGALAGDPVPAPARTPATGGNAAGGVAAVDAAGGSAAVSDAAIAPRVPLHPPFARCRDCHDDAHAGQLARRPDGGACETCHGVEGWKPSRYAGGEHRALPFPLEGRHAEIPCASCHGPDRPKLPALPPAGLIGRAGVLFDADPNACRSCHQDPHEGRFVAAASGLDPAACRDCHGADAFAPATLDPARHRALGFALEGAHAAVPCLDCHRTLDRAPAASTLLLAPPVTGLPFTERRDACADCHPDPHGGQFAARPGGLACDRCHDLEAFAPAARFDHERDDGFPLRGAHAAVPCARCHPSVASATGSVARYAGTPRACDRCHGRGAEHQEATPPAARHRERSDRDSGGTS